MFHTNSMFTHEPWEPSVWKPSNHRCPNLSCVIDKYFKRVKGNSVRNDDSKWDKNTEMLPEGRENSDFMLSPTEGPSHTAYISVKQESQRKKQSKH